LDVANRALKARFLQWACGRRVAASTAAVLLLGASGCRAGRAPGCQTAPLTTDSGLTIEDLECGRGRVVERGDVVTVSFEGSVGGGSSLRARDRFTFALGAGQAISGWEEGIPGMRVGGTRRLVIPPELAFGRGGVEGLVPRGATLTFEIELLGASER
jgi:FKBP-type peptidyl-prolyl cis-trans isomerase